MGKMKELFMKLNYPLGDLDIEREYLINDSLAEEQRYSEYQQLKKSEEVNVFNTKIEVAHGTTIEVNTKNKETNREFAFS